MQNRRTAVFVIVLIAVVCAVVGFAIVRPSHMRTPAAPATAREPVSRSSKNVSVKISPARPGGANSEKPRAFARLGRPSDVPMAAVPQLAQDVRRVAVARAGGIDHDVFVGNDAKGLTCVFLEETPSGRGGGGCNPSGSPFGGESVMWSSAQYNENPQKLVLFGVASDAVSGVRLTFDGGAAAAVPVSEDGGFVYIITKPRIDPADVPKELIAIDAKGNEIKRTDLGITFGP